MGEIVVKGIRPGSIVEYMSGGVKRRSEVVCQMGGFCYPKLVVVQEASGYKVVKAENCKVVAVKAGGGKALNVESGKIEVL